MTKAEEMQRYDEFLRTMPEDSYLRPWLTMIRDGVAKDVSNDIIPQVSPRETYQQCQLEVELARKGIEQARQEAQRQAVGIIEDAHKKAKAINDLAERQAESTRRELRGDIARLSQALSAVA